MGNGCVALGQPPLTMYTKPLSANSTYMESTFRESTDIRRCQHGCTFWMLLLKNHRPPGLDVLDVESIP